MKRHIKLWEGFSNPYSSDEDNMMPPGKYWIGDLCYVMHDKWDRFCEITIDGQDLRYGKVDVDGTEVAFLGTKYGDGSYNDQMGRTYPVDAGLIGAIKVDDITDPNANIKDGNIIDFSSPWKFYDDDGLLIFGKIAIQTNDEEDEYYDEEDSGYEEDYSSDYY